MTTFSKEQFLSLYREAHNNAVDLLFEAELLAKEGSNARAYFLAFTGLEEIAKSQLAVDVYTGLIDQSVFRIHFASHPRKIERVAWAALDAGGYLELESEQFVRIIEPAIAKRMSALYVDLDQAGVPTPRDTISAEEVRSIVHTLRVAIERIIEVELLTGRIGTKGFMK